MCLLAPETKHIGILAFTNTYQSNPASYINCLCPHTHTHTRTSCTWQQRSNKPNSENTDFLENYQVLTSFDLRVVVFFLPVLHRHVSKRTPASFVSLAPRNGKTHEANSLKCWLPARKKKQRKKTASFGRGREIYTAVASTTTVLYLSSSHGRENTTALNHSHEAERPSWFFFFFFGFQRCCVQTPQLTNL